MRAAGCSGGWGCSSASEAPWLAYLPRMTEDEAMRRALDLAWRGWGQVHPNPLVGAVVLQEGQKVGEGCHTEWGGLHAEVEAIRAAGDGARDATLVVTLEPCAHTGKQPPCTRAILDAGIARVVYAVPDPDPVASGGAATLAEAGLEVESGTRREEAERQNAIFLHTHRTDDRPFVALKLATSIDGRIADAGGRSRWISGLEARDFVHWLRAGFDAIAVGAGTAIADDPALTVRGRIEPRVRPRRVVFARQRGLPRDLQVFEEPRALVVDDYDLAGSLRSLRQDGVMSLLVEGGGRLAGRLLAADLVDRFYWVQAPLWLGEGGVPAFRGMKVPDLGRATRWQVSARQALGQDTMLVLERHACSPDS